MNTSKKSGEGVCLTRHAMQRVSPEEHRDEGFLRPLSSGNPSHRAWYDAKENGG